MPDRIFNAKQDQRYSPDDFLESDNVALNDARRSQI
jgi:hypothetical protein